MTDARKTARRIFSEWCAGNGLAVDPLSAVDLVARIETALIKNALGRPPSNSEAK